MKFLTPLYIVMALASPALAQEITPNVYVVQATGLGNGGVAQVGACSGMNEGACRIYLYTGSNPAPIGQLIYFDSTQPAGQRPVCTASVVRGDPVYAGAGHPPGDWPMTTLELDYWQEYPVIIVNWLTAGMPPNVEIALNVICPPRRNTHVGLEKPMQGLGAAPIGGPLPPIGE